MLFGKFQAEVNINIGFVKFLLCQACHFSLVVLKSERLFSLVFNLRDVGRTVSRSLDDTHGLFARYSNRLTFLVGLFMAQVIEKKRLCRNTCT